MQKQVQIIADVVAEIAIKTLFKNFCYRFGGKLYHQTDGGPIGVRATGAASNLVMENWASQYLSILENSGVLVALLAGYVDDGRQVTSTLDLGMRFSPEEKVFKHSKEHEEEDKRRRAQGETSNQRMARITLEAMNSINPDLVLTSESQEDFPTRRLPTLLFEMWISGGVIRHSYFQKSMKTQYVIMERSGMSNTQKYQILSNELVRRMSNIQVGKIPHTEVLAKIEEFTGELKNSEYTRKQAREIIISGLRGWKNKIRKRKRKKQPFYRLAQEIVDERLHKELTEKETWYEEREDNEEETKSP